VSYAEGITKADQLVLADAQTSGGLLIAVPRERAEMLRDALVRAGVKEAAIVGSFTEGEPGRIRVSRRAS